MTVTEPKKLYIKGKKAPQARWQMFQLDYVVIMKKVQAGNCQANLSPDQKAFVAKRVQVAFMIDTGPKNDSSKAQ